MKSKRYIFSSELIRDNAILAINDIPLDGKTTVSIGDTGSKSSRQHGLWWLWCTDVANSGMGSYDTKEAVHLAAKQRWVIPILRRDDSFFCELYDIYKQLYGKDLDKMTWFAQHQVSTSVLSVSQMAEALTDFQRFYSGHGVPLSDPELKLLEMK
jgi:hypothetical protein